MVKKILLIALLVLMLRDCWFAVYSGFANPMRAPDDSIDYVQVLSRHYDSKLATERIKTVHALLGGSAKILTGEERSKRGWDQAYDLRPWPEFPDTDRMSMSGVVLQNLTAGYFGTGGGPTAQTVDEGQRIREFLASGITVSK
jgi:hypothetical protein